MRLVLIVILHLNSFISPVLVAFQAPTPTVCGKTKPDKGQHQTCECSGAVLTKCYAKENSRKDINELDLWNLNANDIAEDFQFLNSSVVFRQRGNKVHVFFAYTPLTHFAPLVRILKKQKGEVAKLTYYEHTNINTQDILQFLEDARDTLDTIIFHNIKPDYPQVLDLSRINFTKLAVMDFRFNNENFTVKLPDIIKVKGKKFKLDYDLEDLVKADSDDRENRRHFPGVRITNTTVENSEVVYYIDRDKRLQVIEWLPLLAEREQYSYPWIISSDYYLPFYRKDVAIKIANVRDEPKRLPKEPLFYAGHVSLLCLPDTLEVIEYGSLSTKTLFRAMAIGSYRYDHVDSKFYGCGKGELFSFEEDWARELWWSGKCEEFYQAHNNLFICEICLMHQFGMNKTQERTDKVCKRELIKPDDMPINDCYWQKPMGVPGPIIRENLTLQQDQCPIEDEGIADGPYCPPVVKIPTTTTLTSTVDPDLIPSGDNNISPPDSGGSSGSDDDSDDSSGDSGGSGDGGENGNGGGGYPNLNYGLLSQLLHQLNIVKAHGEVANSYKYKK